MALSVGNNAKGFFYYICEVETDLPVYIADTFRQAQKWLDCSSATLAKMITKGSVHDGYTCFKLKDF